MKVLPRSFYQRDTIEVARCLLGKKLVRVINGQFLIGIISETEAYRSDDPASHSYRGQTKRNTSMFGPVGHAYVYFSYGLHYCINIVAKDLGNFSAGGVLIRGVMPIEGQEIMFANRGKNIQYSHLTDGPGKVGQAFDITRDLDGIDITTKKSAIFIADGFHIEDSCIGITARIGISKAIDKLWRFIILPECKPGLLK